jgi:hypothetical protein
MVASAFSDHSASDVEDLRPVGGERDLVGGRRMGAQPPLGVPPQFLGRQPAHALHEGAFDLADIDRRVQRLADIVQDVGAVDHVFAGQRVDRDFGHRRRHRRNSRTACRGRGLRSQWIFGVL